MGHFSRDFPFNVLSQFISRCYSCCHYYKSRGVWHIAYDDVKNAIDLHQVNGIDITVAPHDQAVALLTGIRGEISLVVSRDQHDVTPQPTSHGASSTVTWPTTPLDASTLPIIVQPPTPNYAAVESPSNVHQPPPVVKDATGVAMDSTADADVEINAAADVGEATETVEIDAGVSEPFAPDLIDLSGPQYDEVITEPGTVADVDVQLRTTDVIALGGYEQDIDFDFCDDDDDDDDDDLLGAAAVSGVSMSPMSSDIRDMIQHGMLETLRLL